MTNAVALAIKVTADGKSAAAGLDQVTGKTSKLSKVGAVAGKALAAGLAVAGVAAVKATQAAAADEAAQVKLANALKNATGARASDIAGVESWITAQGKALGVADDQLRPAMESLVTATHSVSKAQSLASIAMDISARKGLSLESVSKALAKAQTTGNVAALAKYGVATKDAAGKSLSLEKVTKSLAATYKGSAAQAAGTAAGEQKILSVRMGELQEQIGTGLVPVMLKLSSAGLVVVDWVSKHATATGVLVGTLGGLLAVTFAVSKATAAWNAIQKIWSAATKAVTAGQWLLNAAMNANPIGLVVIAVVALVAALVIAYKKSETFRRIVNAAFGAVARAAGAAVGFIRDHWKLILAILAGPVGIAVLLIAKHWDKIKAGAAAVIGWVRDKWPALKDKLTAPFSAARDTAKAVWDKVTAGFSAAKETLKTTADKIATVLTAPFNAARDAVQAVIDKIQALIDKFKSFHLPDLHIPGTKIAADSSGRLAGGLGGPGSGTTVINITVPGGFIGDEVRLAKELRRVLANADRRAA